MAALPVEVLERWRRTERLLEVLPSDSAERAEVQATVESMRGLYQRLTERATLSEAMVARTARDLERADRLLRSLESRFGMGSGVDGSGPA